MCFGWVASVKRRPCARVFCVILTESWLAAYPAGCGSQCGRLRLLTEVPELKAQDCVSFFLVCLGVLLFCFFGLFVLLLFAHVCLGRSELIVKNWPLGTELLGAQEAPSGEDL